MPGYTYLIIGGGMASAAAISGIREVDVTGSIGVITADPYPPYDRPPLSKWLWRGKPLSSIWRTADSSTVTFHQARTARVLDAQRKEVTDDQGSVYSFSKLLLATGSTPRRLPFGGDQIVYFRTLDDYKRVRALTEHGDRFVVIGSGFIGTEMAAALAMNGKRVTLVFPDDAIGSRTYPAELAGSLNAFFRSKGIELVPGAKVIGCEAGAGSSVLTVHDIQTGRERAIVADGVIAGIGVQPNVELARTAGLDVDDGIRVDASFRTSQPDIYAAGDVASIYNAALDRWRRVEHEDNANNTGAYAGVAMTGRTVSYEHLPFFYSDLFETSYEAVGELDARLEMIEDWKQHCREGVVYYRQDGRVRGVLFWNIYGQVDAGRRLITSGEQFRPIDRASSGS
jgi:NADPH-dependent 2,4-dienoyl-CoA reductase/sulfur reductase-like enzyme